MSAKEISLIALFTCATAVLAQIAIPLPFTPVPIYFGMVGIYITGMFLKPSNAVYAQLCYLLIGIIGLPVFAGFRGGVGAILGPTGGCLMMYPVMAVIISCALNTTKSLQVETKKSNVALYLKTGIALCLALCVEYLGGALWLAFSTGSSLLSALTLICFPFIPLDIVKIIFCVALMLPFRSRLKAMNLLSLA